MGGWTAVGVAAVSVLGLVVATELVARAARPVPQLAAAALGVVAALTLAASARALTAAGPISVAALDVRFLAFVAAVYAGIAGALWGDLELGAWPTLARDWGSDE